MSSKGLCQPCWSGNQTQNLMQLAHNRGPYFDHWRKQMAASVGGILLDDSQKAS